MSTLRIITLDPARWPAFKALRLQALQAEPLAFGASYEEDVDLPDDVWRSRLEAAQQQADQFLFFAEDESTGELVGMIGAHCNLRRQKLAHTAHVYGVYVAAAARGQGIASRLMAALLAAVRANPAIVRLALDVSSQKPAARALYEKFGFVLIGTAHNAFLMDGVYTDDYLMELLL